MLPALGGGPLVLGDLISRRGVGAARGYRLMLGRYSDDALPGVAPMGRRSAGTLFLALFGTLKAHPWRNPQVEDAAHALFLQRSMDMGWLDDRSGGGDPDVRDSDRAHGLWGMNDAGWQFPGQPPSSDLVAWFQVTASALAPSRPLPVQPFLRCAIDTAEHVGDLNLSVVQLLLPLNGLDAGARPGYAAVPSTQTAGWRTRSDSAARTAVRISLNSGQDPLVAAHRAALLERVAAVVGGVFTAGGHKPAEPGDVVSPPFGDWFWNGPVGHGVTMDGELSEWSPDTVGWLAEIVADCTFDLGLRSPLLFTAVRGSGALAS